MIDPSGIHEFRIQLHMATDTVSHDYLRALVDRLYHLRFPSHHEYRGVAHSVHTFEEPLLHGVLVRHMAVVASGVTAVRAMIPCSIIRAHNVAIHASSRVVGQIRPRPGSI